MEPRNTVMVSVEIPDGYELADTKIRPPKKGEWYWFPKYETPEQADCDKNFAVAILRPIVPDTVMVKVPRNTATRYANDMHTLADLGLIKHAMRKALDAKPDVCGHRWHAAATCSEQRGHA